MKMRRVSGGSISPLTGSRRVAFVSLACLVFYSALCARAGSIFDDQWTPPKPVGQPPAVGPVPAPAATNPAAGLSPATQSSAAHQMRPVSRHSIPAQPDQAHSRGLLKVVFANQLKDLSPQGRKKLAKELLAEVPKSAGSASDEYVLLSGAIEASKDAGALDLCFKAAEIMASRYEVDLFSIKIDAVLEVNLRGDSPGAAAGNVRAALTLIDPLLAAEDFQTATRILSVTRPAAASDPDMASVVQERIRAVETLRAARDRVAPQIEKLKASPNDPAANSAVGCYLCFSKGEWSKGLPLLARGSDASLKQAANLEMSAPNRPDDVVRVGDGWGAIAAKQPSSVRLAILQHAASFYKSALESAVGLQRSLIEKRIADVSAAVVPQGIVNSIGIKLVRIGAGEFMMGSPPQENGHENEETLHHVKLTKPFMMAATLVTQSQWKTLMGNNPSAFKGDDRPVEMVSWSDAVAFCEKLGTKEGKHYRLPTEAEWEYAARAGNQTAFGGTNNIDEMGWYLSNSSGQTHPVAQKKPNAAGLYDMQGNAWQWCSDAYGPYGGDAVDPSRGGNRDAWRVLRGGAWNDPPRNCRAAHRIGRGAELRNNHVGFRICLDL